MAGMRLQFLSVTSTIPLSLQLLFLERCSVLSEKKDAMGKSQQYVRRGKQKPKLRAARKHIPRSPRVKPCERPNETVLLQQLEEIFASLPENIIVCDGEGKILRLNAAALKLFEMPSELQCRGRDYYEFLTPYARCHEQQRPIPPEPWLGSPWEKEEAPPHPSETVMSLQVPSGQRIVVKRSCSPVRDMQKQVWGMVCVFHELSSRDRQAFRLQRVHEAVLALTEAIAHLPEQFPEPMAGALPAGVLPAGSLLLSPPVIFIAQQLVTVIRNILDCSRVSLKAVGLSGYSYFVAGSGFSAEQEQPERATSGHLTLTEILGAPLVARLAAKQEVTIQGDRVHLPPDFGDLASENILLVPLFLGKHLTGLLCILKEGLESAYTSEEIELVKAVAAQALLVMQCLHAAQEQTETQARTRALHDVHQLSQDFLILASHELRTPLTSILGNLQLAQRRLAALQRQVATQAEPIQKHLAHAQQPLASASQSAQLQQRMITAIIDDARLQANQFQLHLQQCDLLALLNAVVASQDQVASGHTILLAMPAAPHKTFVLADAERITRVFITYLENALAFSPAEQPVTVDVLATEKVVRVSVHNEGPGIPLEEQEHLWERFYRAKGNTVQHELDLSLGLRLYLCRAFIERHGGQVGVQSDPGHGATFWFTLPIVTAVSPQRDGTQRAETRSCS